MAEFAFLTYYKDPPCGKFTSDGSYDTRPKRNRGSSLYTTLPSINENGDPAATESHKSSKRRFSLDFLFSKKRKFKLPAQDKNQNKRGSADSTDSRSNNTTDNPDSRRTSVSSFRMNNASEIAAWCIS